MEESQKYISTYKQISDIGRQNVVSSMYMHSHPYLFRNAVAAFSNKSAFYRGENYKIKLIEELEELWLQMALKEHEFYDLFLIKPGDIEEREAEFNIKLKNSIRDYEFLQKLNSPSFYKYVDDMLNDRLVEVAKYLNIQYYNNLINNPLDDEVRATLYNLISEKIRQGATISFGGKTKIIKRNLKKVYKSDDLELTKAFKESLNEFFDSNSVMLSKNIAQQNDEYYRKHLKNLIMKYLASFSPPPSNEMLKVVGEACDEIFSDYGTDLKKTNAQVGVIGELLNSITLSSLVSKIENKLTPAIYIGGSLSEKKKPPVDFLIDKFGIQSKNSRTNPELFSDIHIMSALNFETFLDRLAQQQDENAAKYYGYLTTNILWLRKEGVDSGGIKAPLKMDDIPEIMSFITDILSRSADVFLAHRDFSKQAEIDVGGYKSYGNVFYLYKNSYLIPVSRMMDGIIKAVWLNRNSEAQNEGVGYFSGHGFSYSLNKKNKEQIKFKAETGKNFNAVSILMDKQEKIRQIKEPDGNKIYNYPSPLLEAGEEYGRIFRSGIKLKLTYKLSLKQLAKMTNLFGLW